MAEALTLAEIQVLVTTQLGSLRKELDEINNRVKKTEQETKKATNAIGTGLNGASKKAADSVQRLTRRVKALVGTYLGLNATISAVKRSMDRMAELNRLNQQTGIAVERLSALRYAAAQANVSFSDLSRALTTFGARMEDAVAEPTSDAGRALQALGVDIQGADGQIRNFADLLPGIADRFASWADGTNKTAIATKLFGEELGIKLLPLLNRGRDGLNQLTKEANQYGFIVRSKAVENTEQLRKAANLLTEELQKLVDKIVEFVAPSLTVFIERVAQGIEKFGQLIRRTEDWYNEFNRNVEIAATQRQLTKATEEHVKLVNEFLNAQNDLNLLLERTKRTGEDLGDEMLSLSDKVRTLAEKAEAARKKVHALGLELLNLQQPEWIPVITEGDPQQKSRPQAPRIPRASGVSAGVSEAMLRASDEAQALIDRLMGQRSMLDELNFSWEAYAQSVTRAQDLIRFSSESNYEAQRELTRLEIDLMKQKEQAAWDLANAATQALASLFPKQKAFAIANAVVNTAEGVTKALAAYPPPFNFGMAAAVGAAGAAQIAAIARANPGGAASPPRPSTSGGTSRTTPTTSTPPPLPKAIEVVIPPGDIWTSERVSELIKRINNEVSNGSILISTKTRPM